MPYLERSASQKAKLLGVAMCILVVGVIVTLTLSRHETVSDQSAAATSQKNLAQVTITKDGFQPTSLAVKKGTTIVWTNTDDAPHQVSANPHPSGESLPGLKSKTLGNTQSYKYTADTVGTFGYHDSLNPTTNGTIDVQE